MTIIEKALKPGEVIAEKKTVTSEGKVVMRRRRINADEPTPAGMTIFTEPVAPVATPAPAKQAAIYKPNFAPPRPPKTETIRVGSGTGCGRGNGTKHKGLVPSGRQRPAFQF